MMRTTTKPGYIIYLLAFLLWLSKDEVHGFNTSGTVLPNDPKVWTNDTLTLQCEVANKSIPVESKTLHFCKNRTRIPEQYITRSENKRYIELKLPMNKVDQGTYFCYLNDTPMDSQIVQVFRKPVPVENIDCVVYDWAWMRCSWDLGVKYIHPEHIDVSVVWTIDHKSYSLCSNVTNSCTWEEDYFTPDVEYYIEVIVNNTLMNSAQIKRKVINTQTIVKPAAVSGLRSMAKNSTCMEVEWKNENPSRKKHCVIQLNSTWQKLEKPEELETQIGDRSSMLTICGLHPYTEYNVSVKCLPSAQDNFPSDIKVTKQMMPEGVPSRAPEFHIGSYSEAPSSGDKDRRKVTVYWKPISEKHQNGRIVSYELKINGTTRSFTVGLNQGSFNLSLDKDYEIKIRAYTKKGPSLYSRSLYVKSRTSKLTKPTKFYVVNDKASNGSSTFKVKLHWEKPASGYESVTNYTLYYCQGRRLNQTCKGNRSSINGDLDWLNVSPNVTNHTLNLPGSAEDYLFGISADTPTFSSGLLWSTCYYLNKIPEKAPKNFNFTEGAGELSLTVQWERYTCEESSPNLTYNLRYCAVEALEEKTDEPKCIGPIEDKYIAPDQSTYTLYNLEAERVYAVSLRTLTNDEPGPKTDWIYSPTVTSTRLSTEELVGISISCLVVLSFALVGCIACGRRLRRTIQEPPVDNIILPPPVPDMFDSYTEGSYQYALPSSPESPTPITSLLSGGNSTLANSGYDFPRLNETNQEKSIPLAKAYVRNNGSQALTNNMCSPIVTFEKESAVVVFTVDDGKLKPSDQLVSPLKATCQMEDMSYTESPLLPSQQLNMEDESQYTRFTDGSTTNCIGSVVDIVSSGSPSAESNTDPKLSNCEQLPKGTLSISSPIAILPYVINKCHQRPDSELESYVQYPVQTLDSRTSSCIGRNVGGDDMPSVCSKPIESINVSETKNKEDKAIPYALIVNALGYVIQIDGSSTSNSVENDTELKVASSPGNTENTFVRPVSSSLGYVPNVSDSNIESLPTNSSLSSDTLSSSRGYIPNLSMVPVLTFSDVTRTGITAPIVSDPGCLINNTLSVSETGYVSNDPDAVVDLPCEYSPDCSEPDAGLHNSVPGVVASSGYSHENQLDTIVPGSIPPL